MTERATRSETSLAWVALLAGLLPIATVHICYVISVKAGIIPGCVPYLSGCTSISASGRHGTAYFLFKGGMIPAAVVLAGYWVLCRQWLLALGRPDSAGILGMVRLGVISAAFLILYAVFLGSKGDFYNLMRRYGVTIYFSFGFLAQALLVRELMAIRHALPVPHWILRGKFAILCLLLALGLLAIPAENFTPNENTAENIIEWIFGAVMSSYYLLTWRAWKATAFFAGFRAAPARGGT